MGHRFLELAGGAGARAEQVVRGSRAGYARREGGAANHDRLGAAEQAFIGARDSFYLASVGENGWPYVQHRGGPAGFLRVLGERTLGFADYSGNRQYLTLGNVGADDRVALFLMDYAARRRLKLLGRMRAVTAETDPALMARLGGSEDGAVVERGFVIAVEAYDWNCPQHITSRFSEAELVGVLAPVRERMEGLTQENVALRARLMELERTI